MQGNHKSKQSFLTWVQRCIKTHKLLTGAVGIAILLLIIWMIAMSGASTSRSESYKKVSGSAGLDVAIDYDCKKPCTQKYDFNVYIFDEHGRQVNVVRPTKDGKVQLAMSEGDYTLLIGRQFGKEKLFPQERVKLKDGQSLELKLHYKEGRGY